MKSIRINLSLSSIYVGLVAIYLALSFGKDVMLLNYATIGVGVLAFGVSHQGRVADQPTKQIMLAAGGYIAFCILSVLVSNVSGHITTTKGRFISTTCVMLHTFLMAALCKEKSEKTYERILYFIMAAMILKTFQTYTISELMDGFAGDVRLGAELSGINIFGMSMGLMAIFAFYNFLIRKKYRALYLLLAAVLAVLSVTSGSRKAMLGIIVGIVLLMLFLQQGNRFTGVLRVFLIVGVALYALSLLEVTGGVFDRLSTLWADVDESVAASDDIRKDMIQEALKGWSESPLVGKGFNSFSGISVYAGTYSHNNLAELLHNVGIIGTGLYYAPKLIVLGLYIRDKRYTKTQLNAFFLTAILILLAFDMACVTYYVMSLNYLWWLAGAYIIGQVWQEQASQMTAI